MGSGTDATRQLNCQQLTDATQRERCMSGQTQ
jgi:hypothetical protein